MLLAFVETESAAVSAHQTTGPIIAVAVGQATFPSFLSNLLKQNSVSAETRPGEDYEAVKASKDTNRKLSVPHKCNTQQKG